jgi:hypothetical protein
MSTPNLDDTLSEFLVADNINTLHDGNVTDALFAISDNLAAIAHALHRLGTNDAATPMGALEVISVSLEKIAAAIEMHE